MGVSDLWMQPKSDAAFLGKNSTPRLLSCLWVRGQDGHPRVWLTGLHYPTHSYSVWEGSIKSEALKELL